MYNIGIYKFFKKSKKKVKNRKNSPNFLGSKVCLYALRIFLKKIKKVQKKKKSEKKIYKKLKNHLKNRIKKINF